MSELIEVTVPLGGGRDYPVLVGDGALESLPDLVPDHARRVAVVTQSGIGEACDDANNLTGDGCAFCQDE